MTDWTGRRFEAEVGAVAHGGHCVARVEGRVVFVRHALPGELVVVEVTEDRGGSFCRGAAVEVLRPSPARVRPACALAVPGGCGGCDWQHADPGEQRALKAAVVAEQLRRLAGIEWPVEVEELPGGPTQWRTRARLAVDPRGRAGFRGQRSHRVIPVEDCVIAAPGTVDAVTGREWTPGAEISVSVDANGRTHAAELVPEGRGRTRSRRVLGAPVSLERAARREWSVDPHGFWQVHPDAADVLAEVVGEWSGLAEGGCGWDLYAGAGLFASVLAGAVGPQGSVVAVESDRGAAEHGATNLADLPQVRVFAGRVEDVLAAADLPTPDAVVLDPPRRGAGRSVVDAIASRGPRRVVYVACDPAALARDVAAFADHGLRLAALRAFDAFPMTHHVETVALLARD